MNPWVIFFSAVLMSCHASSNSEHPNETALIAPHDSLPIIELDLSNSREALELEIRQKTAGQPRRFPQRFGLKIGTRTYNASIHAPHIVTPACYGMPAMRHKSPQLEVILNEKSQVMMEGRDLISVDSIPGYIQWYFPHDNPYGEKIVKLEWKGAPHKNVIYSTVDHISKGYLNFYRKVALQRFNKSLHELDSTQLREVSKKYPFDLRLWVGDALPTLPPIRTNSDSIKVNI